MVHPRLAEKKIHAIVSKGLTDTQEQKPELTNSGYCPTTTDVRNHIHKESTAESLPTIKVESGKPPAQNIAVGKASSYIVIHVPVSSTRL